MEQKLGIPMDQDIICFCFGYTTEAILKDYQQQGRSTIMERIIGEKKEGNCTCAATNPKGR